MASAAAHRTLFQSECPNGLQPILVGLNPARDIFASDSARRLQDQLRFLKEIDRLKSIVRRTPLLDGSRRETDAEHSWELALMAIVLAEYADSTIAVDRVIRMVLVHDLVEIDAGDTFLYDDRAAIDKSEREELAAERIFALLPADQSAELKGLWKEFEAQETADARFAKALDRLQPLLHNYLTGGGTWKEGGVTAERVLERKSVIAAGSTALWAYAETLLNEAVDRGFLREAKVTQAHPDSPT
jgi:putative hydrolase of HD superfamily